MIFLFGRNNEIHDYYLRKRAEESFGNAVFVEHPLMRFEGVKWLLYKIHNSEKLNNIVNLPGRHIWSKFFLDKKLGEDICADSHSILFFSGDHYALEQIGLFDYLRKKYPKAKLVFEFSDIVSLYEKEYPYFSIDIVRKQFDLLLTYNRIDAAKYSFPVMRPFCPSYDDVAVDEAIPESDIFFIGRDKGRFEEIIQVYETFKDKDLIPDFYIVGIEEGRQKYSDDIHYNETMDYLQVLKHVRRTKYVLNIVQPGSDGLTLRDYEAIGMNKKIITNRDFRDENGPISDIEVINLDNIGSELADESSIEKSAWEGKSEYNAINWCNWLNGLVNE